MTTGRLPPLPDDWGARDSHETFYEYIRLCREEWEAGRRELPPLFKPREREAGR